LYRESLIYHENNNNTTMVNIAEKEQTGEYFMDATGGLFLNSISGAPTTIGGTLNVIGASFTSYTKTTDLAVDAVDGTNAVAVGAASIDEVNGWVTFMETGAGNPRIAATYLDGSHLTTLTSGGSPFNTAVGTTQYQNAAETIYVWTDGNALYVTSKGVMLATLTPTVSLGAPFAFAISASGKYVALLGQDTDTKKVHLTIWQGS
jgi:hypothetical protein